LAKNRKPDHKNPKRPRVITIDLEKVKVDDNDAVSDAIGEVVATTVGDSLRTTIESVRSKRDNVVMVRVSNESLAKLDELVDCGLTNSRSEAAAFLIAEGVKARKDLYAKIAEQSQVIRQAKGRLKELLDDEVIPEPDAE
jgi:Arc/MetJ-type ribon-helix-helix transcriptional regulator